MNESRPGLSRKQVIGTFLALSCFALGLAAPLDILPPQAQRALGLVLLAIFLWTTEPLPLEYSSLIILLLLPALGLLSFQESFSPFAATTVWLLFAGMVLSLGATETGTDKRLAAFCQTHFCRRPLYLLLNLHLIGLLTALLIPSGMVRVLVLLPLGVALVDRLGGRNDPNFNAAVLLSLLCSTYYGGSGILTGTVPNMVVAGQLEQASGQVVYWTEWLRWMLPCTGLARTLLSVAVIWVLFGRKLRIDLHSLPEIAGDKEPMDRRQRRILGILLLGILLWSTDAVHRVAPTYVALGLAVLTTFPGWGPLDFSRVRKVNFTFFFYVAALLSLGAALEGSGFKEHFIGFATSLIDLGRFGWMGKYLVVTWMVMPLGFLMDTAAIAGMITPTMLELGQTYGMKNLPTAMSVAMATTMVFFPYQAAPFMLANSYRLIPMGKLVLTMFWISLLSLLFLTPLNILYWHLFGLI